MDSLQNYGIVSDIYFTQLSFVVLVLGINVGLRQESLRHEAGLQANRDYLEALVGERVRDLDQANTRLALESQERLAVAEALRLRVAELDALQRISHALADRADLATALDQASLEIATLFSAQHVRIDLAGSTPAAPEPARHLMVVPLMAAGTTLGTLSVAREQDPPFSDEERRLAETVAGDLAAAVENERLHERQTRLAAEEERQRLARDLHDAVTQTIYSAALIAEALPAVWERDPGAGLSNLGRLQRLVRAALAEMRTLLFELRPAALEATPLEALLGQLGDALAGQIKGHVSIRVADDIPLSSDCETRLLPRHPGGLQQRRQTRARDRGRCRVRRGRRRGLPAHPRRRRGVRPGRGGAREHGAAHHARTPRPGGRVARDRQRARPRDDHHRRVSGLVAGADPGRGGT